MNSFNLLYIFFLGFSILSAQIPSQESQLYIEGKFLNDECGQSIILKGLNHGNIYDVTDFGAGEMVEVEITHPVPENKRLTTTLTSMRFPFYEMQV